MQGLKLQFSDVEAIVFKLDLAYPGWDRDLMRAMLDYLLPAIEGTLPKLPDNLDASRA